jgi:hypothetical protein
VCGKLAARRKSRMHAPHQPSTTLHNPCPLLLLLPRPLLAPSPPRPFPSLHHFPLHDSPIFQPRGIKRLAPAGFPPPPSGATTLGPAAPANATFRTFPSPLLLPNFGSRGLEEEEEQICQFLVSSRFPPRIRELTLNNDPWRSDQGFEEGGWVWHV